MKNAIISLVEKVTLGKVRGLHALYTQNSLRWWWTPWRMTAYFGAGGWIFLSPSWLWEKARYESRRRSAAPRIPTPTV